VGDFVKQVEVICLEPDEVTLKVFDKSQCEFGYRDSIFKKNPNWIVSEVVFEMLPCETSAESLQKMDEEWQARCAKQPLDMPSAGCTFKNINFDNQEHVKGMKIGGAMISDKHANFIVNFNNASADDIVQLISLVKTRVRNAYGVQIEEEIQYIGF